MKRRIKRLLLFGFFLYLLISLGERVFSLWQAEERVRRIKRQWEEVRAKNEELVEKLGYVESEEFVEKEARDRLNLGKEGEVIIVLPKELVEKEVEKEEKKEDLPNWKKWVEVFFGD